MGIFPLPISRFRSTLRNPRSPVLPRTGLLLFVSKQATSAWTDRRTYFAAPGSGWRLLTC
jgi:hypothetical protein